MIGDLLGLDGLAEGFCAVELVGDETGDIDGDLGKLHSLLGPDRIVFEQIDKIALQGHGTGRTGGDHKIGVVLKHGIDILFGHGDRCVLVSRVEGGHPTAALLQRQGHFDIEMIEDLDQVDAHLRIDEVVQAAGKKGHPVTRLLDFLREVIPQVAQRLVGDRRQRAPFGQSREEQWQVADGALATGHRFLQHAGGSQHTVEQLAVAHYILENN